MLVFPVCSEDNILTLQLFLPMFCLCCCMSRLVSVLAIIQYLSAVKHWFLAIDPCIAIRVSEKFPRYSPVSIH